VGQAGLRTTGEGAKKNWTHGGGKPSAKMTVTMCDGGCAAAGNGPALPESVLGTTGSLENGHKKAGGWGKGASPAFATIALHVAKANSSSFSGGKELQTTASATQPEGKSQDRRGKRSGKPKIST